MTSATVENEELVITGVRIPHLIVSLNEQLFGIPIANIQEILQLPKTVPIPNSPEHLRGAINLRGKVVPILDLRLKLGMNSQYSKIDAQLQVLRDRESDHLHWVAELERSIVNKTPFGLPKNPDKCAFGRWKNEFRTTDVVIQDLLAKMDAPHRKLHESAEILLDMADRGQIQQALEQLKLLKKGELGTIRHLFGQLAEVWQSNSQEQVVIFKNGELQLGLCVDTVEATEIIDQNTLAEIQRKDLQRNGLVKQTARNSRSEVVLMLDIDQLLQTD